MKIEISGTGALVGAAVGAVARGCVTYFYLGHFLDRHAKDIPDLVPFSFMIGGFVGFIAGAIGRPLAGALVGAFLGAGAYYFTMIPMAFCFCLFTFNVESGPELDSLILPMALAGALAGLAGGGARLAKEKYARRDEDNPGTTRGGEPPAAPQDSPEMKAKEKERGESGDSSFRGV